MSLYIFYITCDILYVTYYISHIAVYIIFITNGIKYNILNILNRFKGKTIHTNCTLTVCFWNTVRFHQLLLLSRMERHCNCETHRLFFLRIQISKIGIYLNCLLKIWSKLQWLPNIRKEDETKRKKDERGAAAVFNFRLIIQEKLVHFELLSLKIY